MSNKYLDIAIEKVVKQEVNEVLDKIRAEIDEQIKLYNKESDDFGIVYGLKFAQTIISNYTKGDTDETDN